MPETLTRLTDINLDDLVASFGWQNKPFLAGVLRSIFHSTAEKFARQMLEFDRHVGENGLVAASRNLLTKYVKDVRVFGLDHLPKDAPVLALSNHPGMTDTLCLFAALNRPDLKIIALNRPFLQSLPETSQHLIYVSDRTEERINAVRKATTHLRSGGAVLTFPAGKIEPDPDVYPGALEALDEWTDSAGAFLRLAPKTRILPVLVRGVLWKNVVRNPITKLKREQIEREKLGAAFQLLAHIALNLKQVKVEIQIGESIGLEEVGSTELPAIHAAVLAGMRKLIMVQPG
jgi:hypothetical protein